MMLVTLNRDVKAAFKEKWLFFAIDMEVLCNLFTEKCENNAFENSDTFDLVIFVGGAFSLDMSI